MGKNRLILTLAVLGGVVGVGGSAAVFFTIYLGFRILANALNPEQSFNLPFSFFPSVRLALINYAAGFISVLIVAPFAVRRILSPQYQASGFITTGFLYGAGAGFLCSWLVAFIHVSLLTISGIMNTSVEETLPWTLKLTGYFSSSSMLLFGFLAAAIGATYGSATELCFRYLHRPRSGA
jgi:hypothetical protein